MYVYLSNLFFVMNGLHDGVCEIWPAQVHSYDFSMFSKHCSSRMDKIQNQHNITDVFKFKNWTKNYTESFQF